MSQRPAVTVDVNVIIRTGDKLLLMRRLNTGYYDGWYHIPAGHLEEGEDCRAAAIREVAEEAGLIVAGEDMTLVAVIHRNEGGNRLSLFFSVEHWQGEIMNCEPHKCSEMIWVRLDQLPEQLVPYVRCGIGNSQKQKIYDASNWGDN